MVVLVGTVIGRNIDVAINQWLAYALMVVGLADAGRSSGPTPTSSTSRIATVIVSMSSAWSC